MTKIQTASLAAVFALLGACSSAPIAPAAPAAPAAPTASTTRALAPAPTTPAAPAPVVAQRPASSSNVATVTAVSVPAYLDPKSEISVGRSAYFDFDAAALKPEYIGMVERHGRYLAANPKLNIRVEGNTDDRGSPEYNLALGQKRAESVRQALKLIGVPEARMEAVSWGEERPKSAGKDDAAWAQNRRADIQYPPK